MDSELKKWGVAIGTGIVSGLLLWCGVRLLVGTIIPSGFALFLIGLAALAAGFFVIRLGALGRLRWYGAILFVLSVYFFGRSTGTISWPWLGRLFGLACVFAALLIVYVGWKETQVESEPTSRKVHPIG